MRGVAFRHLTQRGYTAIILNIKGVLGAGDYLAVALRITRTAVAKSVVASRPQ